MRRFPPLRLIPLVALAILVSMPAPALATPFYSVDAARACDTCHVEPIGWFNPDPRDRRCTLDCQGCHVSPTGGGARSPMGRFYGREELPAWGARPSRDADPMRLWDGRAPTEGQYSLFDGFDGWWPGDVSHRTIDDRTGSIDPSPTWQVGGDLRGATIIPTDMAVGRSSVSFPMEAELYLATHPLSGLTAYVDLGVQGSQRMGGDPDDDPDLVDQLWLREVFAMAHDLPWGSYVRAGRIALPYGWRIPDHSAWIRTGQFDQYRQALGVEAGWGGNESWGNLAIWTQGIEGWPGDVLSRGDGFTAQGGVRFLGWQAGLSIHAMNGIEVPDEYAIGPLWAMNLAPFSYLGEIDFRRTRRLGARADSLAAYHEVRFSGVRGATPFARFEWIDADLDVMDDHRNRYVVGALLNPWRSVQLELQWRNEFRGVISEQNELLLVTHIWGG